MSAFPSSQIGLPSSLKYDLPPSLDDSARAYSVNVSPDGITSVTAPAPSTVFVQNSTGSMGNFSSQIVSFTIPSGMSDSVFLDPNSTTLSFTLTYTVNTASSVTGGSFNLIGSGASWFDSLVLYSNNVPVETINQYGLLQNFLLQNTVNSAERFGGFSVCMGCDTNSLNGIELAHNNLNSGNPYKYNFTIPLLSVIGANCPEKLFPIGSVNNLQLQMTTANLYPLVSYCTAVTTAVALSNFTLSEFTLNMKYIDIGSMASNLLKQTLQDGKWFIKAQTYTQSAVTIPNGSNGTQQLLLQIRNTSVKSILHQFGIAQGAVCPNGYYDSVNPGLNSRQCQVGGNFFPSKPINDLQRPSEGYPYLIQALAQGGGLTKAYGTTVSKIAYSVVGGIASVPTGSESCVVIPANALRPAPTGNDEQNVNITKFPNSFYCGYDMEKSSGILFQGVNTRASPPFLNLNIGTSTNATVTVNAWGMSDVILQIDTVAKQIQAFI